MHAKKKNAQAKRIRPYVSTARAEAAASTKTAILAAARQLMIKRGYAGATMQEIANTAGIALDTVYAAVGRKPALFRLLIETALSGSDVAVPAAQRDYVTAIRAEPVARRKLKIYAEALAGIHPRLAPIFRVLETAALADADLKAVREEIAARRAAGMKLFAQDLAATGALRKDLTVHKAADIIWSMNSPEFYLLLVEQRGWKPQEYAEWLEDAWGRLLLAR